MGTFKGTLKGTQEIKINKINMRRELKEKNVRKIFKKAGSYAVTIPIEMAREMKLRDGQRVEFNLKRKKLIIKDWEK